MRKFRAALVEDNTMFANIVKHFLESELEVEVEIFATAESFMESNIKSFNVVLLDYYLNISDFFAPSGEIVLEHLKQLKFELPVVLFSDIEDSKKVNHLMKMGVVGFVPKSEDWFEKLTVCVKGIQEESMLTGLGSEATI